MRWHKTFLGCIVCITGIATSFFSFAASTSYVTKVVTVGVNDLLGEGKEAIKSPVFVIQVQDGLVAGDIFYFNIDGATWGEQNPTIQYSLPTSETLENLTLTATRLSPTQVEIRLMGDDLPKGSTIEIPLHVQLAGKEAVISIDSNNTAVTAETVVFAKGIEEKAMVSASEAPISATTDSLGKISIEEVYGKQLYNALARGENSVITVSLQNSDFSFQETPDIKLVGSKGFSGVTVGREAFSFISPQVLQIDLQDFIAQSITNNKGRISIEGLAVEGLSRYFVAGDISVVVAGDIIQNQELLLAKLTDYDATLTSQQTIASAGKTQLAEITITESLPDTIRRERSMRVVFSNEVNLVLDENGQVPVRLNQQAHTFAPLIEAEKVIGFYLPSFSLPSTAGRLVNTLAIPYTTAATATGDIAVTLEGRGMPETLSCVVGEVIPAATLEITPLSLQVGKRNQLGGKIMIKENLAGATLQGETILVSLDLDNMTLEKMPSIQVVEGDLLLGKATMTAKGLEIPVQKSSTKPSIIVIEGFEVSTTGYIADGRYDVTLGGSAFTQGAAKTFEELTTIQSLLPVSSGELFLVNVLPLGERNIKFRAGDASYGLNGSYKHMDTPAQMMGENMLVPVKYVVEALGMSTEQLKWEKATQTITIYGSNVIEMQVGAPTMRVDGKVVPLGTPVKIIDGCNMVPIGELLNALSIPYSWDSKIKTVFFTI